MTRTIPAIFDAGVFRPLAPVEITEGTRVELQLSLPGTAVRQGDSEALVPNGWLDFVDRMEALPDNSPQDGLSNRDHDRIIYGG